MYNIGENIKKIRLEQNKTQAEFAKQVGLSRSYLGDLENNRKSPSVETIEKLAKNIGVSMRYLFEGEDYKHFELTGSSIKYDELKLEFEYNEKYWLKCNFEFDLLNDIVANKIFPIDIETKLAVNYYFSFYLKEGEECNPTKSFLPDLENNFYNEIYSSFFSFYQGRIFAFLSEYIKTNERKVTLKNGSVITLDFPSGFAIFNEGNSLDFITVL
ncbi:helix-turn-helix transcriptional regulator [Aerococcaceae bacterium DSM 111021]|nr:helix-turn-helix transcriptional regulator [Aerococcaceae bacterium DSM 111021]